MQSFVEFKVSLAEGNSHESEKKKKKNLLVDSWAMQPVDTPEQSTTGRVCPQVEPVVFFVAVIFTSFAVPSAAKTSSVIARHVLALPVSVVMVAVVFVVSVLVARFPHGRPHQGRLVAVLVSISRAAASQLGLTLARDLDPRLAGVGAGEDVAPALGTDVLLLGFVGETRSCKNVHHKKLKAISVLRNDHRLQM